MKFEDVIRICKDINENKICKSDNELTQKDLISLNEVSNVLNDNINKVSNVTKKCSSCEKNNDLIFELDFDNKIALKIHNLDFKYFGEKSESVFIFRIIHRKCIMKCNTKSKNVIFNIYDYQDHDHQNIIYQCDLPLLNISKLNNIFIHHQYDKIFNKILDMQLFNIFPSIKVSNYQFKSLERIRLIPYIIKNIDSQYIEFIYS